MGQFDLNLSTRPFKPYRAANLGLLVLLLLLVAVSVMQFYSYREYSALAAASRGVEAQVRAESDRLSKNVDSLTSRMTSSNAALKLSEVDLLNQLLLRKSFSWTRVFADLERVTPENVRLVSLHPFLDADGKIGLNMNIRGRSLTDATEFLRTLEDSDIFSDTALAIEEKKDTLPMGEVEFSLSTYYAQNEVAK